MWGKKNAKLNCCHYLNQFYHSVSYIYKERRISNQSSKDSSTTVCRIPTFRFFTVDEISVKTKKNDPPFLKNMANYLGFLLFEKEITFFINILIPIVELIMDFFTLFLWEKTTQNNFLVKISVHTYTKFVRIFMGNYI